MAGTERENFIQKCAEDLQANCQDWPQGHIEEYVIRNFSHGMERWSISVDAIMKEHKRLCTDDSTGRYRS